MSGESPRALHALLTEARQNELKLRKFQTLELALLRCRSFAALARTLLYEHRAVFEWDTATLTLVDPELELRRLIENARLIEATCAHAVLTARSEQLTAAYRVLRRPTLGVYEEPLHDALFPASTARPASVAILPLVRHDAMIGTLNIGSRDGMRFRPDAGTDFLEHLTAVIAICLENAVSQERLKEAGLTDGLTGINNRRCFDQRLLEEIARAWRLKLPLSLLFIDIDHFKTVNDTHGHLAGDQALRAVAALIREQVRTIDVVARYGGEEFAVILANADLGAAVEAAERIRKHVSARDFIVEIDQRLSLSVSVGLTSLDPSRYHGRYKPALISARLIHTADRALYEAKRIGRNRVERALLDLGEATRAR